MAQSLKSPKEEPVLISMVADCLAGLSVIGTGTHTNTNKVMAHAYSYVTSYLTTPAAFQGMVLYVSQPK